MLVLAAVELWGPFVLAAGTVLAFVLRDLPTP